jgi:putative two-component system response regulator
MHDVGKIGIPDNILRKPGPLDAEEWKVMQSHAVIGGDIIGRHASGMLAMAHTLAVTHHEKWDGSGYPNGLAGDQIPLVGRIVAIADVFDALTSARPYKQAWPLEKAVEYLEQQRGKHFEPRLVDLFLKQMPALLEVKERWAEH